MVNLIPSWQLMLTRFHSPPGITSSPRITRLGAAHQTRAEAVRSRGERAAAGRGRGRGGMVDDSIMAVRPSVRPSVPPSLRRLVRRSVGRSVSLETEQSRIGPLWLNGKL